jgi:hypothetical protein
LSRTVFGVLGVLHKLRSAWCRSPVLCHSGQTPT